MSFGEAGMGRAQDPIRPSACSTSLDLEKHADAQTRTDASRRFRGSGLTHGPGRQARNSHGAERRGPRLSLSLPSCTFPEGRKLAGLLAKSLRLPGVTGTALELPCIHVTIAGRGQLQLALCITLHMMALPSWLSSGPYLEQPL